MIPLPALPFGHTLAARGDLPIPAWLFAWAASGVLIVSFFALSVAWREPRLEDERWRALTSPAARAVASAAAQALFGALGVALLGIAVYAGLRGTEAPDRNLILTFFFVTVWLGFPGEPSVGPSELARGQPTSASPTGPTPSGSAAGPPRSASSPSSGSRSSTASAAPGSRPTRSPSPRSCTAATRSR